MNIRFAIVSILASAFLTGITSLAQAQVQSKSAASTATQSSASASNQSLLSKVEQANFVFQGVVTQVEYRLSDKSPDGAPQLPYTFVTYKIEELLKGESQVKSVTLQFLGGPHSNGKILKVMGAPFFDVGDQDILFVSGNSQSICPLLGCEGGRFRLINNQVFNDLGHPQSLTETGELISGKRIPMQDVLVNQVGDHTVEYEISEGQEEPLDNQASKVAPATPAMPGLSPQEFTTEIRNDVQQLTQEGRLQVQPVVSTDIKASLAAPLVTPSSPPIDAATGQPSDTERQEQERETQQEPQNTPIQK
jgi:hypothetical protein